MKGKLTAKVYIFPTCECRLKDNPALITKIVLQGKKLVKTLILQGFPTYEYIILIEYPFSNSLQYSFLFGYNEV
jgi:hypothetical protein